MSGGGNWEFEMVDFFLNRFFLYFEAKIFSKQKQYVNNRSNSYTRDSILYLKPTLTADRIGEANLEGGYMYDMWGGKVSANYH